jgi:hypothetical protein
MPRGPKGEKRLADGVSAIVYGSKSYFQSNQVGRGCSRSRGCGFQHRPILALARARPPARPGFSFGAIKNGPSPEGGRQGRSRHSNAAERLAHNLNGIFLR